jgi:hypothetical protein
VALSPRSLLVALTIGGGASVAAAAGAVPAAAHGGGAAFDVIQASEVAPGTVTLRLAVLFEADGHEATGAFVDVIPTGPTGGEASAVRLARETGAGTYAATFELDEPGRWTLEVTSSFPPGRIEIPVRVAAPVDGDPAAGEEQVATTGEPATALEGAAPGDDGSDAGVIEEPEAGGAEGGSDATNLVVAAVSGILGGALGLWVSRRRAARRREASADGDAGGVG